MTSQSMTGCFAASEQDFSYQVPKRTSFGSAKEACCCEASRRFATEAQFDRVVGGKMRRCPDQEEPLHKDCKIRVTGKPYGSTRQVGLCAGFWIVV